MGKDNKNWPSLEPYFKLVNDKIHDIVASWSGSVTPKFIPWTSVFDNIDALAAHIGKDEVHLDKGGYEKIRQSIYDLVKSRLDSPKPALSPETALQALSDKCLTMFSYRGSMGGRSRAHQGIFLSTGYKKNLKDLVLKIVILVTWVGKSLQTHYFNFFQAYPGVDACCITVFLKCLVQDAGQESGKPVELDKKALNAARWKRRKEQKSVTSGLLRLYMRSDLPRAIVLRRCAKTASAAGVGILR